MMKLIKLSKEGFSEGLIKKKGLGHLGDKDVNMLQIIIVESRNVKSMSDNEII